VETHVCSSAAEAIEHSCELKPDLIVSDVILRDMSAIDAGCRIRNLLPGCAVLFYSGAMLNRLLDDSETQIAIGKAVLQLAATAARAQRMYLIRT
jgi:CheY-like chemotaxis protein